MLSMALDRQKFMVRPILPIRMVEGREASGTWAASLCRGFREGVGMENPEMIRANARARTTGRPPAKHSSPDYTQMTVYVRTAVRSDVRMRLFREGRELSALIERLLIDWLNEDQPPERQNGRSGIPAIDTGGVAGS